MDQNKHSRRAFLRTSGSFLGGSWFALHLPAIVATADRAAEAHRIGAAFDVLSPFEAAELEAIAAQIIPSDDTGGAREAGTVYFIDQALGSFMAGAREQIQQGLDAFEASAREQYPGVEAFSALSSEQQIEALRAAEQTPFFGLVRYLVVAGTFVHPSYGGNRNGAGWELLGFDDRHVWQPPFGYYDENHASEDDDGTDQ